MWKNTGLRTQARPDLLGHPGQVQAPSCAGGRGEPGFLGSASDKRLVWRRPSSGPRKLLKEGVEAVSRLFGYHAS